jgi:hypothetical protein
MLHFVNTHASSAHTFFLTDVNDTNTLMGMLRSKRTHTHTHTHNTHIHTNSAASTADKEHILDRLEQLAAAADWRAVAALERYRPPCINAASSAPAPLGLWD